MPYAAFWFGTEQYAQWIDVPLSGAESTPEAWSASGSMLNGGGYAYNSFGSHKLYSYEWRSTSARRAAQLMKSYADGTFGRGLLYFVSPLIYDTNILPAGWADPSMALDDETPSLVYGVRPTAVATENFIQNRLPVQSVNYNLNTVTPGAPDQGKVFLPVPRGFDLHLGAFHDYTGTGGVFYVPVYQDGTEGEIARIEPLHNGSLNVVNTIVYGVEGLVGVRLFVGRLDGAASSVRLTALTGRLIPSVRTPGFEFMSGPWYGGQGHSGCRFEGKPTYIENTGVNGGQIGYAATFREVGMWE